LKTIMGSESKLAANMMTSEATKTRTKVRQWHLDIVSSKTFILINIH
jgi:hypothetical protein